MIFHVHHDIKQFRLCTFYDHDVLWFAILNLFGGSDFSDSYIIQVELEDVIEPICTVDDAILNGLDWFRSKVYEKEKLICSLN